VPLTVAGPAFLSALDGRSTSIPKTMPIRTRKSVPEPKRGMRNETMRAENAQKAKEIYREEVEARAA
jgi:hypothetical protein